MRRQPLFVGLLVAVSVSAATAQQGGTPAVPVVTFRYSNLLDVPCYTMLHQPVDSAKLKAMLDSLPAITAQWRKDAPVLFATAARLTNVPFQFREAEAALITCPGLISMSLPLIMNVGLLMDASRVDTRPLPARFSSILFHEVLHRYVFDRLEGRSTPALRKYAGEPQVVRGHLYNVAIMEEVYRVLRRTDDLAATANPNGIGNTEIPGVRNAGDMRRALEIIAAEGPANLVKELSARSAP